VTIDRYGHIGSVDRSSAGVGGPIVRSFADPGGPVGVVSAACEATASIVSAIETDGRDPVDPPPTGRRDPVLQAHAGRAGPVARHRSRAAEAIGPAIVLTDRTLTGGRTLAKVVRGARAVILREKDLPRAERAALAAELRSIVDVLLVASDAAIDADGVHLAAADPFPDPRPRLVGRSCHTPDELASAAAEGCDYATLSPIFTSPSKPGYGPLLGVEALTDPPLPVYALGGVDDHNAASCLAAGATGVAVMGAVMRSDDPAGLIRRLAP
jgi:thiamine-phosphate diphosphorylase